MAKKQGKVGVSIEFNVNQNSLNNIKKSLQDLRKMSKAEIEASGGKIMPLDKSATKSWKNDLGEMRKELDSLGKAFEAAYNPKLGTYELNKFNASLKESGTNAQQAFSAVSGYGEKGKAALLDMTTNMLAVDRAAKQVNNTFKKLGDTMMNTLRWTITSTAINTVTGAVQQAYHYTLDLDKSLNDIRIVTNKSSGEMEKFAREANKAAKALGASTTEYTDASLIYYQQGLNDKDVRARSNTTIKAAAITGQSAAQVSEQLTAVWNGYKVSADEAELYIDKLSAVAATTAADLEELSVGMSKVASAANIMGVDADQLNAQLATIVSVTREAPESIGTALKTVYARMSDIEAGLDTETTLGEYTSQMAQMGINVVTAQGNLRDMGEVVEEIGNKWSSLNREQQVSLAQSIAGTRQYSRMMALFDNWDMYQEAMTTSMESAGALTRQHAVYLESTEAHMKRLTASAEGLYDSIFDSEEINGVYDTLSGVVTLVDELVQALGGMPGLLAISGMLFAKIGKQSIANLITTKQENILNAKRNQLQLQHGRNIIASLKDQQVGNQENIEYLDKVLELEDKIYAKAQNLTDDQWQELQDGVRGYNEAVQQTLELRNKLQEIRADKKTWEEVEAKKASDFKSWTSQGKESKTKKSYKLGTAQGRKAAQDYANKLKTEAGQKGTDKNLANAKLKEAKAIERAIAAAKKNKEEYDELIKTEKQLAEEVGNTEKALDDYGETLTKTIDKDQFANQVASVLDGLTTIAFTATGVSSSVTSLWGDIRDGETDIASLTGSIGGLAMSFAPLITSFMSARAGLKKVKAENLTGAAAWTAYWAAATVSISAVITVLTTVFSLVKDNNEATAELAKKEIEEAQAKQEEAKANKALTKSYLELYEAYTKTGEGKEELANAAEQIIEKLDREDLRVLLLAEDYEKLAEKIRKARYEEEESVRDSAEREKKGAEALLESKTQGNTAGVAFQVSDYGGMRTNSYISAGSSNEKEDIINSNLLKEKLGDKVVIDEWGNVRFNWPTTAEEAYEFYKALQEAYDDKRWEPSSKSEIHKNVQKILGDEDWVKAYESYEAASEQVEKSNVNLQIQEGVKNQSTSVKDFAQQRQAYINQMKQAFPDYSDDKIAALVDSQFTDVGGENIKNLLAREQFVSVRDGKLAKAGVNTDQLREALDLNTFSNAEFTALGLIDLENFRGKVDDLLDAAKRKLAETREQAWAAQSEERIKSLKSELERLEEANISDDVDKATANMTKQVINLVKQQAIYKEVYRTQEKTFNEAANNFRKAARENNIFSDELKALIESRDWETLRDKIETISLGNEDQRENLLTLVNKLMTASNELLDAEDKYLDIQDTINEKRLEGLEKIAEAYDSQREALEDINSLLEHRRALEELIYGNQADLSSYYSQSIANKQKERDSYQSQYDNALAIYNSDEFATMTELEQQNIKDTIKAAGVGLAQSLEDLGQLMFDQFQNFVSKEIDAFSSELAGGLDKAAIDNEIKWAERNRNRYLNPLEVAYGKDGLRNRFKQSMQNTSSIAAQTKINDLMEEQFEILEDIDKLSQYDLDRAEKKLQILEAEIALQEAQDAKSEMRLMRTAFGEYTYQYVANMTAIEQAQEKVKKANQELYELDLDRYQDNLDTFYEMYEEYLDAMAAAYEDGTLSEAERAELQKYQNQLRDLATEATDSWDKVEESVTASANLLGQNATETLSTLGNSFSEAARALVAEFTEDGSAGGKIEDLFKKLEDQSKRVFGGEEQKGTIITAFERVQEILEGGNGREGLVTLIEQLAPSEDQIDKWDRLSKAIENAIWMQSAQSASERDAIAWFRNSEYAKDGAVGQDILKKAASGEFGEVAQVYASKLTSGGKDFLSKNESDWQKDVQGYANTYDVEDPDSLIRFLKSSNVGYSQGLLDFLQPFIQNVDFSAAPSYGESNPKATVAYWNQRGDIEALAHIGETFWETWNQGDGSLDPRQNYIWERGEGHSKAPEIFAAYASLDEDNKGIRSEMIKYYQSIAYKFDTGGYTGDWTGSDGRLAVLHKKELILNEEDSSNFLDALQILRSLNLSMLETLGGMSGSMHAFIPSIAETNSRVQQMVQINAEFPDATDAEEIKEAFEQLVDLATQKAFENSRV